MALKYTHEELVFLKDSPLCTKPENLPPAEEWMGPPVEQQSSRPQNQQNRSAHNGAFAMGHFEQVRGDKTLLDQTNRRPDLNRHASRNSATNPEDIVFGPPRMQFSSAGRKADSERTREGEPQNRMNNFRARTGEGDGDRFREGRNANPLRRRDGEQDNEGWSTVKPRKSFGADGAERFQGRMGMTRDDKRQSRETERPSRGFDQFQRDTEEEGRPRNGLRGHKTEGSEGRIGGEKRERMDRAKSWRDKAEVEHEDHPPSRQNNNNRHWGRDGRAEREPEWLDEPVEPKTEVRTQKDFQKWMEEMKKQSGGGASSSTAAKPAAEPTEGAKAPMRSPPADSSMDKFFMAFGAPAPPAAPAEESKAPAAGKSSRFTSFFATQETPKAEATPRPPPSQQQPAAPAPNGLLGALMAAPSGSSATPDEKQAFQNIIAKLKVQSMSATPPGQTPFAAPPNQQEGQQRTGPSPFQTELENPRSRQAPPPQHPQEIHAPRPQQQTARPDQLMQDLLGHHQRVSSQSSGRTEVNPSNPSNPSRSNSNTEFLMNLMRAPDSQRSDSAMMRATQHAQKGPMPPQQEREGEFSPDEGRNAQRMRGPPPGFGPNDMFRGEGDFGRGQPPPPHILQRPQGPPGLEQMPPGFMGGPMPPPQQQGQQPPRGGPMLPPPGLQGGRGLPPGMFPPGGPPPHMHPDMGNMPGPPRNMGMPPPGFFGNGPPPPGGPHFMPPGMGGFNGPPGPDSPFSPGPGPQPFERGMPGARGGNFGRG